MEGFKPAEDRPGYMVKTIQHGAATIHIYRPILDDKERAKRERHVQDALSSAMSEYIRRTTPAAV